MWKKLVTKFKTPQQQHKTDLSVVEKATIEARASAVAFLRAL